VTDFRGMRKLRKRSSVFGGPIPILYEHGKNGFVTATKLGTTKKKLLQQPKILPQQPNVLLMEPNILL